MQACLTQFIGAFGVNFLSCDNNFSLEKQGLRKNVCHFVYLEHSVRKSFQHHFIKFIWNGLHAQICVGNIFALSSEGFLIGLVMYAA